MRKRQLRYRGCQEVVPLVSTTDIYPNYGSAFRKRRRTKIKNDKVELRRMELAPYTMQFALAKDILHPILFLGLNVLRQMWPLTFTCVLQDIHDRLCHPGVTRMLYFIRSKNLSHSTTDVNVSACKICARVKPLFVRRDQETLIKAMRPMERISIDFKDPLPSSMNILAFRLHFRVKT